MSSKLKPFATRVRWLRAWRGLWMGLAIGGVICLVWAALDLAKIAFAEPLVFAAVLAGAGLVLALIGFFRPVAEADLAASIDRRAELRDRLTSSREIAADSVFGNDLQADADEHLKEVKPGKIYPIRFGKFEVASVLPGVIAFALFGLSASQILLSPATKEEKKEVAAMGAKVERIAKPIAEQASKPGSKAETRELARELERLQQEMQKGRIEKPAALQKAAELNDDAQKLAKAEAQETLASLADAEKAAEQMTAAELTKANINMDPARAQELAKMTPEQIQKETEANQAQQDALKQQQEAARNELENLQQQRENPNLTPEQQKQLDEKIKALQEMMKKFEKELQELQKMMDELRQSKEIQEMLKKINEHPAMKELQEMAQKLQEEAQRAENGEAPQMTKEQIEEMKKKMEEMKKQMEELAKQLQDPQALDEYMKKMKEALENMGECQECQNAGMGLGNLLNLPGTSQGGTPSSGSALDKMGIDTGKVNSNETGKEGQGKTRTTSVRGQRQDQGKETFIEVRGPTTVGSRTSIPLSQVLPNARKKAESAIDQRKVPKQHERRVKDYFDSLGRGGK